MHCNKIFILMFRKK